MSANHRVEGLGAQVMETKEQEVSPDEGIWAPDPMHRFELRWWDGHSWTDYVSTWGEVSTDPLLPPPSAVVPEPRAAEDTSAIEMSVGVTEVDVTDSALRYATGTIEPSLSAWGFQVPEPRAAVDEVTSSADEADEISTAMPVNPSLDSHVDPLPGRLLGPTVPLMGDTFTIAPDDADATTRAQSRGWPAAEYLPEQRWDALVYRREDPSEPVAQPESYEASQWYFSGGEVGEDEPSPARPSTESAFESRRSRRSARNEASSITPERVDSAAIAHRSRGVRAMVMVGAATAGALWAGHVVSSSEPQLDLQYPPAVSTAPVVDQTVDAPLPEGAPTMQPTGKLSLRQKPSLIRPLRS